MDSNISPIHKLDIVLEFLSKSDAALPKIDDEKMSAALKKQYSLLADQRDFGSELIRILNKLIREGYVEFDDVEYNDDESPFGMKLPPKRYYRISFDGKLFIDEQGGYVQEAMQKKLANDLIRIENSRNKLNQKVLMCGAVGAAIGSIGFLIWDIVKYYELGCR